MHEFQTTIIRLQGKVREDEETMTDLLNERARMGWTYRSTTALHERLVMVVFQREV